MVVTTISCDATILRCSDCQKESAIVSAATTTPGTCMCGAALVFVQRCSRSFSLRNEGLLIRCIVENKDGWCCEAHGGRDFCPDHTALADPWRIRLASPLKGEALDLP